MRAENVPNETVEQFADWLSADEQHQWAWGRALSDWQTLGALSHLPVDQMLVDPPAETGRDRISLMDGLIARLRERWMPLAMAVSMLFAVAVAVLFDAQPEADFYAADTGDYKQVLLADGSVVELNTDSAIEVTLTHDLREIVLLKGEAFFAVAPDQTRPFIVDVSGATVRAVGTAFNILKVTDERAVVAVTEGIVRVKEASGSTVSAPQTRLLTADSALQVDLLRGLSDVDIDAGQVTAWRHGQLLFDNTPLTDAVQMLNRYLIKKVEVADSVPSSIRLSGTFSSRQKRKTLLAVADALGLELTPHGDKWLLSQNTP